MDLSAYIDIPILCLVYVVAELLKRFVLTTDKKRSLITIIGPVTGAFASVVIFLAWPQMSTSATLMAAFTNGVISGAAATGVNQIYKQISKFLNPSSNDDNND